MKMINGIPTIKDYQDVIKSELFHNMEIFSNTFIRSHQKILYNYLWDNDPLHHWSRQYEYPFAFHKISSFLKNNASKCRILDAGSGVTFFPYYIGESFENALVSCCDQQPLHGSLLNSINDSFQKKILFDNYDLQETHYEDSSFDIIYCLSVLEHTTDYEKIINEFKRILKPSGLLIITIDICIEGKEDIPPEKAEILLEIIYNKFPLKPHEDKIMLINELNNSNILTSGYIEKINPSSVPQQRKLNIISLIRTCVSLIISDNMINKCISGIKPGLRKVIREKLSFIKKRSNMTICCGVYQQIN